MSRVVVDPGMVFNPSDVEILSHYLPLLIWKEGDVKAILGEFSDLIQVSDIYSHKPSFYFSDDELDDALGRRNQRFVFSPRVQITEKNCDAKRPKRGVTVGGSEVGFWKSSTGDKAVLDDNGVEIGFLNTLNFYEYSGNNENGKRTRKDEGIKKTSWIMKEYKLGGNQFQHWGICKIKDKDAHHPKTD